MTDTITYTIEVVEMQRTVDGEVVGTRGLVTATSIEEILRMSNHMKGDYGNHVGCFRICDSNHNALTKKQYWDFMRQIF